MRTPESREPSSRELLDRRVAAVLAIPLHRFLGVRLTQPDDPGRGLWLHVGGDALNNADVLHGGVLTALLDVACYLAVLPHLGPGENAVTHDISASILRPVPAGTDLLVAGEVVRAGRSLVFARAEATVAGRLAATASVTKSRVAAAGGV